MNALIEAENDHLKYHVHMLSLKVIDLSSEVDRWERRYHEEIKLRLPLEREILILQANARSFDIELQSARHKLAKRKTSKKGRRADGLGPRLETVVEESHGEDETEHHRNPSPASLSSGVARTSAGPPRGARVRSPSPLLLPARTRPRGFTVSSTRDDPEETGGDPSTALDLGQKQADTPDEPKRPPSPSSDAEDDNEPDHAEADGGPPEHMVDELVDDESREAATVMQSLALPRIVLHPPSSPMAEQPSPVHPPDRVDTPSSVAAARASSPTLESTPQSSVPTSPGPGSCSPEVQHDTGVGTLMPHVNAAQEAFFASSREAQEEFEALDALDVLPCVRHYLLEGGCPAGEGCSFKHHGPRNEKALKLAQEIALNLKWRERDATLSAKSSRQTSPAPPASTADPASRPTSPALTPPVQHDAEPHGRSPINTAPVGPHAAPSRSPEASPPRLGPPLAAPGFDAGWYLAPPGFHGHPSMAPPPGSYYSGPPPPFRPPHGAFPPPPPFTTFASRPSSSRLSSRHAPPLLPMYTHPPPPLPSSHGHPPPDCYGPPPGGYWVQAPPSAHDGRPSDGRRTGPGLSHPPSPLPPLPPPPPRARDADDGERRQTKRMRYVAG